VGASVAVVSSLIFISIYISLSLSLIVTFPCGCLRPRSDVRNNTQDSTGRTQTGAWLLPSLGVAPVVVSWAGQVLVGAVVTWRLKEGQCF
jgi:hypothetical protein